MSPEPSVPECTECGRCCVSPSARHVPLTGDDWSRLEGAEGGAEAHAVFDGAFAHLRMVRGRCAVLEISPGPRFRCRIYPHRPEVCRTLERGSPACLGERETKAGLVTSLVRAGRPA